MAFGALLGTDGAASTSPGTGIAGAGLTVAVGDLVVVAYGMYESQDARTRTISDDLVNTWTPLATGVASDSRSLTSWYSRITVAGTCVITTGHTSATADASLTICRYEGPFLASPLDKNPTNTSDTNSPYNCPSSGTLTQADELVIGMMGCGRGMTVANNGLAATAPSVLDRVDASGTGANTAGSMISSRVVAATTAVAPEFTVSGSTENAHKGTSTYLKDTGGGGATPTRSTAALPLMGVQ